MVAEIVAQRLDAPVYLVRIDETMGRVLDARQRAYFPPTRLQIILKHGYWNPPTPNTPSLASLLAQIPDEQKEWDESLHPRDERGQFTSGDFSAGGGPPDPEGLWAGSPRSTPTLVGLVHQAGGFTYQPITHDAPKKGMALSPYPKRETVVDAKDFTSKDVLAFQEKNADILAKPNHYMGAWFNHDDNKVYLDISVVTQDTSEATVHALLTEYNQIAAFDLATGKEVRYDDTRTKATQTEANAGIGPTPWPTDGRGSGSLGGGGQETGASETTAELGQRFARMTRALADALQSKETEWNEEDHPRVPAGEPDGGQFTSGGGAGSFGFADTASGGDGSHWLSGDRTGAHVSGGAANHIRIPLTGRMADYTPKDQEKIEGVQAKIEVTPESMEAQVRAALALAKEQGVYDDAANWYQNAHQSIEDMATHFGVEPDRVAAMIAVLSPRNNWNGIDPVTQEETYPNARGAFLALCALRDNPTIVVDDELKAAMRVYFGKNAPDIETGTTFTARDAPVEVLTTLLKASNGVDPKGSSALPGNIVKAVEIARADDLSTTIQTNLSGNKVTNFYANLSDPDANSQRVTVDGIMARLLTGNPAAAGAAYTGIATARVKNPDNTVTVVPVTITRDADGLLNANDAAAALNRGGGMHAIQPDGTTVMDPGAHSYPMFAEAVATVAADPAVGLTPMQVQSVTWTAFRAAHPA